MPLPKDDEPELFGEEDYEVLRTIREETDGVQGKMKGIQDECKNVLDDLAKSLEEISRLLLAKELEQTKAALSTYRQLSMKLCMVVALLSETLIHENSKLLEQATKVWKEARKLTSEQETMQLSLDLRREAGREHARLEPLNPSVRIKNLLRTR